MIHRSKGRETLVCDECGDDLGRHFLGDEFPMMIAEAKMAGWAIRLVDGPWTHLCPDCKGDEPEDRLAAQRRMFGR